MLETPQQTDADIRLCATALWLAAQAITLREKLGQKRLPTLSTRLSALLAIATLNREHFVLEGKLRKAQKAAHRAGTIAADQLANVTIGKGNGLFDVDAGSITDAAIDAVDSWLYEAADVEGGLSDYPDLADAAIKNVQRFSLQRGHYDLWQHALWEDWHLTSIGRNFLFVPADPDLAALLDACLIRTQSNFVEYAWIDLAAWPQMSVQRRREVQLPLTVVGMDQKPGKRRQFVIGRPSASSRRLPAYLLTRSGLEGSYLAPFLERPLPTQPDLTCELLLRAWYVLDDLTEVLAAQRPRATFHDLDNVRRWASVVRRSELAEVLRRALSIKDHIATKIIGFLSWAKGTYKGLWGAPLVPLVGRHGELMMAHNVLATSNVVRRVEIWLTKGGLDDNLASAARGDSYEAALRREIREDLRNNSVVTDGACAEHAIKKGAHFPEQIDLLLQFASLLLVCEIKCLLFPTDARERYNFLRNIEAAARQAIRKAAVVDKRREFAAQALGIPETRAQSLRVLPIVVVNQGFGMSLQVDDCIVTDAKFLKLYLGSGTYVSEAAVNPVDGRWADAERHLYRTASEAVDNFEQSMRRPPPLYRFVDQLCWTTFAFPTYSGNPLLIARTELADPSAETRSRYEALHEIVSPSTAA